MAKTKNHSCSAVDISEVTLADVTKDINSLRAINIFSCDSG